MKEENENQYTITKSEGGYGMSEWFGAIFYQLLSLGHLPFKEIHIKKHQRRNVWTGWLLQVVVALFLCFGMYLL